MSENSIERLETSQGAVAEPTPVRPEPVDSATDQAVSPRRGTGLSLLALLLAAAGLGGSGWLWLQQQALTKALSESATERALLKRELSREDAATRDALEAERGARAGLASRLDQMEAGRDALSTALASMDAKLRANLEHRPESWRAAEAEYLVRLAALRLGERDVATALRLLADADRRVADLPQAGELRAALATDSETLRAAPRLDLQGLVVKLEALLPQIPQLPTLEPTEPEPTREEQVQAELDSPLQKSLKSLWQVLKRDWIEVRHYQGTSPELELPEIRHYLNQNLALALQQAEWAATRGDNALYQGALERASVWAKRYFDAKQAATTGFIAALDELKQQNVAPAVPGLEHSLAAVHALVLSTGSPAAAPVPEPTPAPETPQTEQQAPATPEAPQ